MPEGLYDYYDSRFEREDPADYAASTLDDGYLSNVAEEVAAGPSASSDMAEVNTIASFVQGAVSAEEEARYAVETLVEGGDGDDRAVLLSSLSEMGYGTVFLDFGDHLMVGVAGEFPGASVEHDGERYFFLKPSGDGSDSRYVELGSQE